MLGLNWPLGHVMGAGPWVFFSIILRVKIFVADRGRGSSSFKGIFKCPSEPSTFRCVTSACHVVTAFPPHDTSLHSPICCTGYQSFSWTLYRKGQFLVETHTLSPASVVIDVGIKTYNLVWNTDRSRPRNMIQGFKHSLNPYSVSRCQIMKRLM